MHTQPTVELVHTNSAWTLLRDGQPYQIRGAAGKDYLEELVASGGNSIRTWDAVGIDELLDEAHRLGLTVTVGIWLEHERHGYDYDKPQIRARQLAKVRRCVRKYRDHPAVLMWALGNEVELGGDLDKALRAIEEAAAIAKQLDPHHPTMAVLAEIGEDKARRLRQACPSIDVLGINSYGGAASVPERLREQGWTEPYVLTEFGPLGHWETGHTAWGAPFEPTSAEKFEMYTRSQRLGVEAEMPGRCLGSYAFLWGSKVETTPTWFGMFLDTGERTPTVDAMQILWTGKPPENRAPLVHRLSIDLDGLTAEPGEVFNARAEFEDPEADELHMQWVVRPEQSDRKSGGDAERTIPDLPGLILDASSGSAKVRAPLEPGAYRLYFSVHDGHGGAGTANIPFLVKPPSVE